LAVALATGADARRHTVPSTGLSGVRYDAAPPNFTFDLGAGPTSLAALAGRPVLINFWASYCDRVRIITLSNEGDGARDYLQTHHYDLPLVDDRDNVVWKKYGVLPIPTTILLRPNGTVRYVTIGETSYEEFAGLLGAAL
jgi:thiol-disulfide isomerase/thioredoxin